MYKQVFAWLLVATSIAHALGEVPAKPDVQPKKPHVLFLLADDYGWANLGYHRIYENGPDGTQAQAEVQTPNLDKLIDEGIHLRRAYAYKICSPSRSSIQSGRLAVHVNTKNVNVNHYNSTDPVSGYAGIPTNMTGLASKMREGGYRTHFIGKWDVGMAHPSQTPLQKGYESFFGYYQHANDYWMKGMPFQSTGEVDNCLNRFVDFSLYNKTYRGGVNLQVASEYGCSQETGRFGDDPQQLIKGLYNATGCPLNTSTGECLMEGCYEEAMFLKRGLKVIDDYATESLSNAKATPLFLFYAFHALHTPLQVPQRYLEAIDKIVADKGGMPIATKQRRLYAAMVLYMDEVVGKLRSQLEKHGMWKDTLVIFSADNGGPIYEPAAANNHPLRGGKFSDFEGGVRVNSFVSGGANVIPQRKRGTAFAGIISVADWYGTLCEIAGVDQFDHEANKTNAWLAARNLPLLPKVDSISQWGPIFKGTNGRTEPLHLSSQAILDFPYKLIMGRQPYSMWQGALYPNCSIANNAKTAGPLVEDMQIFNAQLKLSPLQGVQDKLVHAHYCDHGCLFDVQVDPGEHNDLSINAKQEVKDKILKLRNLLVELNKGGFEPGRGTEVIKACEVQGRNGGFFGPFVEADDFYTPVNMSQAEQDANEALQKKLGKLNIAEKVFRKQFDKMVSLFPLDLLMNDLDECIANETIFDPTALLV